MIVISSRSEIHIFNIFGELAEFAFAVNLILRPFVELIKNNTNYFNICKQTCKKPSVPVAYFYFLFAKIKT